MESDNSAALGSEFPRTKRVRSSENLLGDDSFDSAETSSKKAKVQVLKTNRNPF